MQVVEQTSAVGILALEDDPVFRLLLEHEFPNDRYNVTLASNAEAALRLLQAPMANYQIAIVDLKVPSEEGGFPSVEPALMIIEAARKVFPRIIIITISSVFLNENLRLRLLQSGVGQNLPKPFSLHRLHEVVDGCL